MRGRPRSPHRVREASRRLRQILRTSRKLSVCPEDLAGLRSVTGLRGHCRESLWSLESLGVLGALLAVLLGSLLLLGAYDRLQGLACHANTTKELQIQTMRLDRPPLDSHEASEEPTIFNDSEDKEDSRLWSLRLRER